jgi:murein DD-endopeptidase MepM/ murein hydrolase activator NlpD
MARRKRSGWFTRLLILLAVGAVIWAGVGAFRVGPAPTIEIEPGLPGIGRSTPVAVRFQEPERGIGRVKVEVVQGERSAVLGEAELASSQSWKFWGPKTAKTSLKADVGRAHQEWLQEGSAVIRATAGRAGSWLRRPDDVVVEQTLEVRLRPPALQPRSNHVYVKQGGCEVVVYTVGASSIRDGVRAGDWFFPGHPLPGGGPQERFALFSAPWDLEDGTPIKLEAVDDVDNRAEASFIDRFTPHPARRDTIRIDDRFMSRVVPSILANTPELRDQGDLLANYVQINNDLRRMNADTLEELAMISTPEFLWDARFVQLPNSKVTSTFADRRTYVYNGSDVDRQDHLGFDLASVAQAEVPAANSGTVVLARYFGIYGNAVVIDHGYGLQSLYGHLSSIGVEEGQQVERGQTVGRTGATGLAGGDHLHFTMLLQGLAVNPREWWDGHWIRDRLKLKLGAALPFDK